MPESVPAPDWLVQLVERMLAEFGLPPASAAAELWPESLGRGFILGEAARRPMTTASTIKLVRPGVFGEHGDPAVWHDQRRHDATVAATLAAIADRPISDVVNRATPGVDGGPDGLHIVVDTDESRARAEAALIGVPITSATVDAGTLRLELADGAILANAPDPRHEGWEVHAAGVGVVHSLPGGEVASFSFQHAPYLLW
jgi:hypothetical protein